MEPQPPPRSLSTSLPIRIGWAVLILATLYVCYFSHLGAIGFVGPDEPRYAWIARDMAETGDWVTPRLYGKPWFEKPPLYYWSAALSFKLFGVSEAAARLPSAISALLATLALAWLAHRLYGAETARWLLLLLPTTVGMIGFSHAAATDMPFSAMLTIAMVAAAVLLELIPNSGAGARPAPPPKLTAPRSASFNSLPSSSSLVSLLFGFFLGQAVLAKGPAALILCGGAVLFWALFTKRWRDTVRLLHPIGIIAFCVTALPWYILCAHRNPDFFRIFVIEHNFKRYLTPEFRHIQPFWYYVPVLGVALLPWTPLVLWSAGFATARLWRTKQISDSGAFLLAWALFCIVFFSTSHSKLPGYILPSVPAVAVLVAHSCAVLAPSHRKSFRLVHWTAGLIFLGCSVAIGSFTRHMSLPNLLFADAARLVAASLGASQLFLACLHSSQKRAGAPQLAAACSVLPILAILCLTATFARSLFDWDPSGKSIAHEIQIRDIPGDKLSVKGMNRGQHFSLNFYLHREIKDWNPSVPTEGYVVASASGCKNLAPPSFSCKEVPFNLASTGRFLFRVAPVHLLDRPPGSRQSQ